jgi:polyisoprenoid-binding protein YceI
MPRRSPAAIFAAIALLVVVAAGAGLWYLFLREAGPPPVSLRPTSPPSASITSNIAGGPTVSIVPGGSVGALPTTWAVVPSPDSFVGYRVKEQLASIGANTAVGRTSSVVGSLTLSGTSITAVELTADMTTLRSDSGQRDGRLATSGIETSRFPTATFSLTSPIALGGTPAAGATVNATASGALTLHGVTKAVQIPVEADIAADVATVKGSIDILFSDYGIERPTSFAVLSVEDHGTMEFQLAFHPG